MGRPVVVVHGGAGRVAPERLPAHEAGCAPAAAEGLRVLLAGGSALDAAQRAVEVLEADPLYNAGTGGSLNREGELELDAALMNGADLRVAGVAALPPYPHPVRVARALLDDDHHVLLCAAGADAFARARGFEPADPEAMITAGARERLALWRAGQVEESWAGGTVGAVAYDGAGGVAAATSTGGTVGKAPGRIGDSPIPGAGTWADDRTGACSATGVGEAILRVCLARYACDQLRGHSAQAAVELAIAELEHHGRGSGGVILVSATGEIGVAKNTATMSHAIARAGEPVRTGH